MCVCVCVCVCKGKFVFLSASLHGKYAIFSHTYPFTLFIFK